MTPEIFTPCLHRAQYYETDRMGIIHHSNYIRWMEEARVDFLEKAGLSYAKLEQEGIGSLVTAVQCEYHSPVRFAEEVEIRVTISEYNGIRLRVRYEMTNLTTGKLCTIGTSEHCFLGTDGKILSLRRSFPEIHARLASLVPGDSAAK